MGDDLHKLAKQLSSRGMLEHIKGVGEALPVSLMVRNEFFQQNVSRNERKQLLRSIFIQKLNDLIGNGLEVDFNSLSTSAQSIEAKVSVNQLSFVLDSLRKRDVEVSPNNKMGLI